MKICKNINYKKDFFHKTIGTVIGNVNGIWKIPANTLQKKENMTIKSTNKETKKNSTMEKNINLITRNQRKHPLNR